MRFQRISFMGLRDFNHKLISPKSYTETCKSNDVCDYFEENLPILKNKLNNNNNIVTTKNTIVKPIVIMDNAQVHRSKTLQAIFDKHGVTLIFLPPYCPIFNPIEHKWFEVKYQLRSFLDTTISMIENVDKVLQQFSI
jgi:DDE superfamily endonuclease